MNVEYMLEGYGLMMTYMREQRILTKHKSFRRKLDKFYNTYKDKEILDLHEEKEYLQLEQYFYNTIVKPSNSNEQALTTVLNLLANVDYED